MILPLNMSFERSEKLLFQMILELTAMEQSFRMKLAVDQLMMKLIQKNLHHRTIERRMIDLQKVHCTIQRRSGFRMSCRNRRVLQSYLQLVRCTIQRRSGYQMSYQSQIVLQSYLQSVRCTIQRRSGFLQSLSLLQLGHHSCFQHLELQ